MGVQHDVASHGDSGGASRFLPRFRYQPKPCTAEREAALALPFPEGAMLPLHALHKLAGIGIPVEFVCVWNKKAQRCFCVQAQTCLVGAVVQ